MGSRADGRGRAGRGRGFSLWPVIAAVVAALAGGMPAGAGDVWAKPSPRTVVEIGGASVVMVVANDQLYAFVDRLEDNAPLADAALSVDRANGATLKLTRATDGLFVAPFRRSGRPQDDFVVSLVSAAGTGDAAAEIAYGDAPVAEPAATGFDLRGNAAVALVSGAVGAGFSALLMLLTRGRRRAATEPVGSALVA